MRILVCLDGSTTAERVLPAVQRTLAALPNVEVHLLRVLNPNVVHGSAANEVSVATPSIIADRGSVAAQLPRVVEDHGSALERVRVEASEALQAVAAGILGEAKVIVHVDWSRDPAETIVQAGKALGVATIAMATHGRSGVSHLVAGSVTEEVLRRATVPVLVVGPAFAS